MLPDRPEFYVADLVAVTIGATPFSIYNTYPAEQMYAYPNRHTRRVPGSVG